MLRYFVSREFIITLLLFLGVGFGTYYYFFEVYMPTFTLHGKTIIVPNLYKQDVKLATENLKKLGLDAEIKDSIYNPAYPAFVVLKQYPADSALAKPGRKVLLMLNKKLPTFTRIPRLVDLSVYQAKENIELKKLIVKQVLTVPDLAKNIVLKATLEDGKPAEAGKDVPQGTKITLTIGGGGAAVNHDPVEKPASPAK